MRFAALVVGLVMIWPASALAERHSHAPPPPPTPTTSPPATPPFEPRERDFTVDFPNPPKLGFKLFADGKERSYLDNEGDRLFMVTASTFMMGAKEDEDAYNRRLNRFADSMGVTLSSQQPITWSGAPGWEGIFTSPQGSKILVRMTVHDKRLYQAVYEGPVDEPSLQGERFMESFRLIDR